MREIEKKELDSMAAKEISSILDSELTSEEKSALLASYWTEDDVPPLKINTHGSSSGIKFEAKTDEHKKADAKDDAAPREIKINACSRSPGVELEEKIKHTEENANKEPSDEEPELKEKSHPNSSRQIKTKGGLDDPLPDAEISSVLQSNLISAQKSSLLMSSLKEDYKPPSESTTCNARSAVEHMGAIAKEEDNHSASDEKSKRDDKAPSHPSSQQVKTKGALDPLTDKEISSILISNLTSEEKSSLLITFDLIKEDTPPSEIKTSSTRLKVELEEQGKVATDRKPTSDEKSRLLTYNQTEVDIPKSKASSSRIKFEVHVEDCHISLELKQECFTARVREPRDQSNIYGEEDETIYKEEAVCKSCYKCMLTEVNVLKAKCKCKCTLIHEECATKWAEEKGNKCTNCEEEIKNIHVTLVLASSFPSQANAEKPEKPTSISKRFWSCLC